MGFKGISWSISGNIFRVIACTNVCFVHCSYLSKCRYCRRTFDFLKEISLPLLCSTMQWEFTLSPRIEILSWERNGSLKIRGDEGSDFKLFQELCLTRSKVETFKILRLFGVKKKPWKVGSRHFKDEDYLLPNTSGRQLLKGGVVPFKFDWSSNFKARRKIIRHVERYWLSIVSIPVMPL